jgi:hypothetical protein
MIAVFKFALDETGQVVERSILSDHHADRTSAVAFIEGEISKYPSHGYDEDIDIGGVGTLRVRFIASR